MASLKRDTTAPQSSSVSPDRVFEREAVISSTPMVEAPSATAAASNPILVRVLAEKTAVRPPCRRKPASSSARLRALRRRRNSHRRHYHRESWQLAGVPASLRGGATQRAAGLSA